MGNALLIAAEETHFCQDSANIWRVVGWILFIFKIVIPIILIILGMIDLGKAVVSSKDDEIKKSMKQLMFRAIAAVAIFFVPTIVSIIMGIVGGFASAKKDYEVCKVCIANPLDNKCAEYASKADSAQSTVDGK